MAFNVGEHVMQSVGEYVSLAEFWESVSGIECESVRK